MEQKKLVSEEFSGYFHIGQIMDIQTDDDSKDRFQSQLVGVKENSYLLIEQPNLTRYGSLRDKMISKQKLIIRTIDEKMSGDIIGFRTVVNFKLFEPERLLAITYPSSVEIIELRKESRAIVQEPCIVMDAGNEKKQEGVITDLSKGGCRIEIKGGEDLSFNVNDKVNLSFTHPISKEDNQKTATIRSCRKQSSNFILGLSF